MFFFLSLLFSLIYASTKASADSNVLAMPFKNWIRCSNLFCVSSVNLEKKGSSYMLKLHLNNYDSWGRGLKVFSFATKQKASTCAVTCLSIGFLGKSLSVWEDQSGFDSPAFFNRAIASSYLRIVAWTCAIEACAKSEPSGHDWCCVCVCQECTEPKRSREFRDEDSAFWELKVYNNWDVIRPRTS